MQDFKKPVYNKIRRVFTFNPKTRVKPIKKDTSTKLTKIELNRIRKEEDF